MSMSQFSPILKEVMQGKAKKKQTGKGISDQLAEKKSKHSTRAAVLRRMKKNKTGIGGF